MFGYYVMVEESAREHLNDLIRDAEHDHQLHEFLKSHPECTTSAKIRAFLDKLLGRRHKSDLNRNSAHAL